MSTYQQSNSLNQDYDSDISDDEFIINNYSLPEYNRENCYSKEQIDNYEKNNVSYEDDVPILQLPLIYKKNNIVKEEIKGIDLINENTVENITDLLEEPMELKKEIENKVTELANIEVVEKSTTNSELHNKCIPNIYSCIIRLFYKK
jgi:hypothetical protein